MNQTKIESSKEPITPVGVGAKELLAAGAHFGHQTRRWNPKMAPYIFAAKNNVHVIDLIKTDTQLKNAINFVKQTCSEGGKVLFIGTKRQARPIIESYAKDANMPYVTHRWLGGTLTNLKTIKERISTYKKMAKSLENGEFKSLSKKEQSRLDRKFFQLNKFFIGLADMDELPQAIYVVDVPLEGIAIREARRLNIPVVAITDTNADPDQVDYVIAANDDAIRSIDIITRAIATAAKDGAIEYDSRVANNKKEAADVD